MQALLARWPNHTRADLVATDGFVHSRRVLEERGIVLAAERDVGRGRLPPLASQNTMQWVPAAFAASSVRSA